MLRDFNGDDLPYVFKGIEKRVDTNFTKSLYKQIELYFNKEPLQDWSIEGAEEKILNCS
jgi:hypothetical protein